MTNPVLQTIPMWGSMNDSPQTRNHGWGLGQIGPNGKIQGWPYFVDKYILPMIDKGWKRLHYHNPGGTKPVEDMQFDQFIHAREEGFDWIGKNFVNAWIKATRLPGVECICYLGTLPTDENFAPLSRKWSQQKYLERLLRSVELPLAAGMSIGFDAIGEHPENNHAIRVIELFQSLGIKTYVEPWININNKFAYGWNHITTNQLEVHLNPAWSAPEEKLTGEKIILLNSPESIKPTYHWSNYYEWAGNWHENQWNKGRSVMVGYDGAKMPQFSAQEYLKRLVVNQWS